MVAVDMAMILWTFDLVVCFYPLLHADVNAKLHYCMNPFYVRQILSFEEKSLANC